ncbi:septum site-determining protein MinC [Candidatus Erwinia dacicola]|uniref:Probable septum site-determining protein MinC n=1 Tax=Candidatus Erwinia dacicola TaxID=252393 RepID=A0A1E7YWW5_9GAMM|nr:septum site-determining protein MinC [Candidatus Erwinia dacicola]OFC61019.1 septum site-determining protein MinC [Candidatus Erwinia dacicola]RAP71102.1 septum site-determining protein MinC [Candidatus Erwinia dacicola]
MSQSPIELKGSSFTLSVVHLHHTDPDTVRRALKEKVSQAPAFLKNAPVVVNVSSLSREVNWRLMQQAIVATGLHIVGISGCKDEQLKRMIALSGLPVLNEGKEQKKNAEAAALPVPVAPTELPSTKPRIISTPVRSGQQIYAKNSDLIVTNSVSAGAELIADGNIHIYGMMRGRALAGASGDKNCQIFCTSLSAELELVSIAGNYWIMDQIPAEFLGKASRLCLKDGVLTIQTLN